MKLIPNPAEALAMFNFGESMFKPSEQEQEIEGRLAAAEAREDVPLEDAIEAAKPSEEELKALYVEVANLDSVIEQATERKEAIKTIFRRALPYGTKTLHGESGGGVTIGRNPIFDEIRFLETYPYDHAVIEDVVETDARGRKKIVPTTVYPNRKLYKITPDRPVAKKLLSEEEYAAMFNEGDPKVTIR